MQHLPSRCSCPGAARRDGSSVCSAGPCPEGTAAAVSGVCLCAPPASLLYWTGCFSPRLNRTEAFAAHKDHTGAERKPYMPQVPLARAAATPLSAGIITVCLACRWHHCSSCTILFCRTTFHCSKSTCRFAVVSVTKILPLTVAPNPFPFLLAPPPRHHNNTHTFTHCTQPWALDSCSIASLPTVQCTRSCPFPSGRTPTASGGHTARQTQRSPLARPH